MITYKDTLKLKLEKLQKAIDDISNINYGSLRIGGGVIVDMTVDNINASTITTNILKVNNDTNLKNLTVEDLSVVNTITSKSINSSSITNSDTITTKNHNITGYLYLRNGNSSSNSYVRLYFDGNLKIDESIYLSTNKYIYHNNVTYLYDHSGYLYFCKGTLSSGLIYYPRTNYKFLSEVFGFYDSFNNIATLSTGFTQCYFSSTEYNDYYFFLGFKCHNKYFKAYYFTLSNINLNWDNTTADYYRPRVTGNTECCKISTSSNNNALGTGDRYYHSLYPCNFSVLINNTTYRCYVLRDRSSKILSSNDNHLMFKFTDVYCQFQSTNPFPT